MICPTCNKVIDQLMDYTDDGRPRYLEEWECPDGHAHISGRDGLIVGYTLFFEKNNSMYKMVANKVLGTTIYSRDLTRRGLKGGRQPYVKHCDMPQFIEPIVKDDIIQIGPLITRLSKLVAFS